MKTQRFAIGLTVLNLFILMFILFRANSGAMPETAAVLRGRALELGDARGRVRAAIKVLPALATVKMPDGTAGYPESVQLRLISWKGGPDAKLAGGEAAASLAM